MLQDYLFQYCSIVIKHIWQVIKLSIENNSNKLEQAFAYIVYGNNEPHYLEALLSILTLIDRTAVTPILVLTEKPEKFEQLNRVITIRLTNKLKAEWLGDSQYHFKIKLLGLKFLLKNHTKKLIFLDSDTLVRKNLNSWFDKIDQTHFLMHKFEGVLGVKKFKRNYLHALNKTFKISEGESLVLTEQSPMYNSGVIGISDKSILNLDKALSLMEQIDRLIEWHTAEQLALGTVLNNVGKIRAVGNKHVYHYWYKKRRRYIREQMMVFFNTYSILQLTKEPKLTRRLKTSRTIERWIEDKLTPLKPLNEEASF